MGYADGVGVAIDVCLQFFFGSELESPASVFAVHLTPNLIPRTRTKQPMADEIATLRALQ